MHYKDHSYSSRVQDKFGNRLISIKYSKRVKTLGILVWFACRCNRKEFSPIEKVSLKKEKGFLFKKKLFYKWKGFNLNEIDSHHEKHGWKVNEKKKLFYEKFFQRKKFLLFSTLKREMKRNENYFYQPYNLDLQNYIKGVWASTLDTYCGGH